MVAIGQQLICDPDWHTKVAYNTATGMKKEAEIRLAETSKWVLVGHAGLEPATL